jgi:hypothetical protein
MVDALVSRDTTLQDVETSSGLDPSPPMLVPFEQRNRLDKSDRRLGWTKTGMSLMPKYSKAVWHDWATLEVVAPSPPKTASTTFAMIESDCTGPCSTN